MMANWLAGRRSRHRDASVVLCDNVCGQEAAKHAIAFEDMIQMHRVADPKISPDGKWVAFAVATPDMNANRNASKYLDCSDGGRRGRSAYAERARYFASVVARRKDAGVFVITGREFAGVRAFDGRR